MQNFNRAFHIQQFPFVNIKDESVPFQRAASETHGARQQFATLRAAGDGRRMEAHLQDGRGLADTQPPSWPRLLRPST